MIVVIDTQYCENYGAHAWDGEGECPQHWKFKGGSSYKVVGVPEGVDSNKVVMMVGSQIEHRDNYSEEYILGHSVEDDSWLSSFERSQLEYEGVINYPEPVIQWQKVVDSLAV